MIGKYGILILLLFGLSILQTHAQDQHRIDSLEIEKSMTDDPVKKMQLLIELARTCQTPNPDLAFQYATEAARIAEDHNSTRISIQSFLIMANYYWKKTNYKEALEFATKDKSWAERSAYESEYAEALLIVGNIYFELGDFTKSTEQLFQALSIFEELNDEEAIADVYNSIGATYYEQNNLDKALEYGLKSLAISRKLNDLQGVARLLNNIGIIYGELKEFEKEENYYRESLRITKKLGWDIALGMTYQNIGGIYSKLSQFDSSFYYYEKAYQLLSEVKNIQGIATSHLLMAQDYLKTNEATLGLKHAHVALELGEENHMNKIIHESSILLHQLYELAGDMNNAYRYALLQNQIKDSLDYEVSMARLSQMEMKYEYEKRLQENQAKQKLRELYYKAGVGTVVLLLLVLITFLVFRYKIKIKNSLIEKRQLEADLELRNKEMTSSAMSILKTNEVLAEITDSLKQIRKEAVKDETKSAIKKIADKIQRSTKNNIWEDFELRFQQVHGEFYDNLLKEFPNLTPNELRLCALLRLNLTNKEISELTGQRTSALEIARSRLRKKLGMTDRKTSLVIFLSKY